MHGLFYCSPEKIMPGFEALVKQCDRPLIHTEHMYMIIFERALSLAEPVPH